MSTNVLPSWKVLSRDFVFDDRIKLLLVIILQGEVVELPLQFTHISPDIGVRLLLIHDSTRGQTPGNRQVDQHVPLLLTYGL